MSTSLHYPSSARASLLRLLCFGLTLGGVLVEAHALPRMSLTAGSPCATCHITAQGGGARNEIGWGTELFTRMVGFEKVGLKSWDEAESNGLAGGKVMVGGDLRMQLARLGKPTPKANPAKGFFNGFDEANKPAMMFIPMQFQPYVTVSPNSWMHLTGSYNISTLEIGSKRSVMYPGQAPWEAQMVLHFDAKYPQVRVGYLQPTIGIRHDDHTMLIRSDALNPRQPAIPAGYAELGGELNYQPVSWLRVDAGAFLNTNLRAALGARAINPLGGADKDGLAWLARVSWLPQFLDLGLNTWLGASAFGSEEYMLLNGFFGVGKGELGSLQVEVSRGTGAGDYETLNLMALLSYNLKEWFVLEARLEQATASAQTAVGRAEARTRQLVVGAQFFPLPYIELRPEYRLILSKQDEAGLINEYALGQYTLQVHLFF